LCKEAVFSGDSLRIDDPPFLAISLDRDYLSDRIFRGKKMAERRAEKPKKVKLSPKQQEFYDRLRSSK